MNLYNLHNSQSDNPPKWKCLNAFGLKLTAAGCMLLDHLWATVIPGSRWMTDLGRMAFPLFAFLLVEGYCHTRDLRAYAKRLLVFALLSELPFNLMTGGSLINPFQQNVLFTFLLSLAMLRLLDRARKKGKVVYGAAIPLIALLGYFLGMITFVDYYGYGVLTVLVFYLFRGKKLALPGMLFCLLIINCEMMGGLTLELTLGGRTVFLPQQSFALLSLIPISLYNGTPGPRIPRYAFYAFYPLHMLLLALIWRYLL